jgi:Uma2 family endonuclease
MAIVGHKVPRPEPPWHKDPYFYGWRMVERQRADGSTFWDQVPLTEWDVLHPQEGDFIVQNDIHNEICAYLKYAFRWRLAGRPRTLVLSDHRIDWQVPGVDPHGPDITVLFHSPPWDPQRGTYLVRDLGADPRLAIEATSPSTRRVDLHDKVNDYKRAGVPLYVIIDQGTLETSPALTLLAYQATPQGYERVPLDEHNRLWLEDLQLWLAVEGDHVVCLEPDGTPIGDYLTVAKMAQEAEARAEAERQRAEAEKARAEGEKARAEAEKARAEGEKARAEAEKARAEDAEEKVREMAAELRRLRGQE